MAAHVPTAKRHKTSAAVRCDTGEIKRKAGRISPCAPGTYITLVAASASAFALFAVYEDGNRAVSCCRMLAIVVAVSRIPCAGKGYTLLSRRFTSYWRSLSSSITRSVIVGMNTPLLAAAAVPERSVVAKSGACYTNVGVSPDATDDRAHSSSL